MSTIITTAHFHGFLCGILLVIALIILIAIWQWVIEAFSSSKQDYDEWMDIIRETDRTPPPESGGGFQPPSPPPPNLQSPISNLQSK